MKKDIVWLLICLLPLFGFSQINTLNKGIRIAYGMSNIHDQKLNSSFGYKPSYSICLFIDDNLKRNLSYRVELSFSNKGTKQLPLEKTINLNYITANQLVGKHFKKVKTALYAGIYEGYLLNPQFDLGYNGFYYYFNVLDFGLTLRPSIVVLAKNQISLQLDFETSYSLVSVYNNTKKLTLKTPESAWTRNFCFNIGINLVFAPGRKSKFM